MLADLAILFASAVYAMVAVFTRIYLRDVHPMTMSVLVLVSGFVCSAPIAVAIDSPLSLGALGPVEWTAFLMLGFGTAIANCAYYWLLSKVGAVKASMNTYIMPATGVFLGWAVLGEGLGWHTFVGLGAIALGVALANEMLRPGAWRRTSGAGGTPVPAMSQRLPAPAEPTTAGN